MPNELNPIPDTSSLPDALCADQTPTLRASQDNLPIPDEFYAPDTDSPYTLGALIGRGGYGDVFEATQGSLGRSVAIKKLRSDVWEKARSDKAALQLLETSFRKEAFIMASLEHPSIPPIHDMAIDDEARPMLVMKLLRGQPWDQQIRRDFLLPGGQYLARHLPILISVAQAVAFAHSRGVIHRDIKPSQVMVGEYGDVQLMDWGIAVTADEVHQVRQLLELSRVNHSTPVPRQAPSGTAAFMAPEQTQATIADVGPWTDVFLLGGTLYFLLTGRTPYNAKDVQEAFHQARQGNVVAPSLRTPERHIPREVEEITMRALEKLPQRRFPSVEAMIEALQDYLSGQTRQREAEALIVRVEGYLESDACDYDVLDECANLLEQASLRWSEHPRLPDLRHEVALRTVREALDHGDLVLARVQLGRLAAGEQQRELTNRLAALEESKLRAEDRLQRALFDAKSLVGFMVNELYANLQSIGRLDLLDKVARKALDHFDAFPDQERDAAAVGARVETLGRIASVLKSQGRLSEAERILKDSVQQLTERLSRDLLPPDDPAAGLLSDQMEALAEVLYDQGDLAGTRQWHSEALRVRERAIVAAPDDVQWQRRIASSHHHIGVTNWREGNQPEALASHERALDILHRLLRDQPQDVELLGSVARAISGKGWVLRAMGHITGALRELQEALATRQQQARLMPGNLDLQAEVAWSLRSLALLQEDMCEYDEALAAYLPALESCQFLMKADPANPRRRMELAFTYGGIGRIQQALGRVVEARDSYEQGCLLQRELSRQDPTNVRLLREYAYNILGLSSVLLDSEDHAGALREARLGVRVTRTMYAQIKGANPYIGELLGRALVQLAYVKIQSGEEHDAQDHLREAINLLRPLFNGGNHPAVQEEPLVLAMLLAGRTAEAKPYVERLVVKGWKGRLFRELAVKHGMMK